MHESVFFSLIHFIFLYPSQVNLLLPQFQATYGKPLLAARDPKCSPKDAEAGALAMEALHKQVHFSLKITILGNLSAQLISTFINLSAQVMPFLLRRTKDEVLLDLPEKIIQDRYCELSPAQLKLYEQFSHSDAKKEISTIVGAGDGSKMEDAGPSPKATSHIFQVPQTYPDWSA